MIGLATIGQAPRDDVVPYMFSNAAQGRLLQAGALDALNREDVSGLKPGTHEHPLVTLLGNGEEVSIAKERVSPLLQEAVDRLEIADVQIICVLCTGEFDLSSSHARLIYPDRVLTGLLEAMLPSGTVGVLVPHPGQVQSASTKWGSAGRNVIVESFSPYDPCAVPEIPLNVLKAARVDAVVLDCMGYSNDLAAVAQKVTGVPVLQANRLVGAILETLL